MTYKDWLSTQGISNLQGYSGDANKELFNSYMNLDYGKNNPDMTNIMSDFDKGGYLASIDSNDGLLGVDWLNKENLGLAGQGLGLVGGLANMYSNLWGQNADLMDTQIGMLKDQRNYNKELIANKRQFNKNLGEGLAGAFA